MDSESDEEVLQDVTCNDSASESEHPMHVNIKKEEEVIIEGTIFTDNEEDVEKNDCDTTSHESPEPSLVDVKQEYEIMEVDVSASFENSENMITRHDPPAGICSPPPMDFPEDEEQFELLNEADAPAEEMDEDAKKLLDTTQKAEDGRTSLNSSLVDHPYSNSGETGKEFCDGLVHGMLKETGNEENKPALMLLSRFTDIFEHFIDDDGNSQVSLYLKSMKKTVGTKIEALAVSEMLKAPKFEDIPPSQETEDIEGKVEISEVTEIPETEPSQLGEQAIVVVIDDEEPKEDSEVVSKLKRQIEKFHNFSLNLTENASNLNKVNIESDENAQQVQLQLMKSLKDSRKEFRALCIDIRSENISTDINEKVKKKLIASSSDELTSSCSDSESKIKHKRKRKFSKEGPQTPAIVSSTKEDSDVNELEISNPEANTKSSSDDDEPSAILGKEIEKLLNFETLQRPKPPKNAPKLKKMKRVRKKRLSTNDNILSSSSDDSKESQSSTVS